MPSRATAERWNRELKHFRFCFAHGGHANDMDTLSARLPYDGSLAGLEALFGRLELPLARIAPGAPRVEPGRSYGVEEWRALPKPMAPFPDFADPLFTSLYAAPAYVSVRAGWVEVMACGACGNAWEVTESDFDNARRIEAELERRGVAVVQA